MRVALVTVGDELLAGDTVDTNASWLAAELTDRGADVERITTVPDRVADIARVVNEYQAEYDAVVVTGGLGPTHDDLTMRAVAAAFGADLVESDAVLADLERSGYVHADLADGTADLPAGAEPLHNPEGVAPGCHIGNVYVLPGVPEEMAAMFETIADEFAGEADHVAVVEASEPESALLDRIAAVREEFSVTVGSYPGEVVRLKVSGPEAAEVEAAATWLREHVEAATDV